MEKITGNENVTHDLLDVLLILKDNTMKSLNVAEIAIITAINNEQIICTTLNDSNTKVVCTKLSNLEVSVNDVVLIVFTNSDFRQNLSRIKSGQKQVNITTIALHDIKYGVIVGIIYKENSNG